MRGVRAFERQALPHMDAALTLARWLVRDRSVAEDIVQDAYLRAFRSYDGFRGDDIRPWLLKIVRNVAYRWISERTRGSNVVSLDDAFHGDGHGGAAEPASDEPSAEERLIAQGERSLVIAALEALPPLFREVLVLREIEGLSYREIAGIANVPVGTVMSRLARARAHLRTELARRSDSGRIFNGC